MDFVNVEQMRQASAGLKADGHLSAAVLVELAADAVDWADSRVKYYHDGSEEVARLHDECHAQLRSAKELLTEAATDPHANFTIGWKERADVFLAMEDPTEVKA